MSNSYVITTPVQITLFWQDVDAGSLSPHPLGGVAGTIFRAILLQQLQQAPPPGPAEAAELTNFLSSPLKTFFDNAWTQMLGSVSSMLQKAVLGAAPNAYGFNSSIPQIGTSLSAYTSDLSTSILNLLPPGTAGTQLALAYSLPGFSVSFKETTSGLFGSWADPSYNLTFDAEIDVFIGVPDDILVPLAALAEFNTTNMQAGAGNFFAVVIAIEDLIPEWLGAVLGAALGGAIYSGLGAIAGGIGGASITGGGTGSTPQNQSVPIPNNQLQVLLGNLSLFASARQFGFTELGIQINLAPLAGTPQGPTVEFDLTHLFDPGPVVTNALLPPVLSLFPPQISTSSPEVNAGGQVGAAGNSFPPAQASQLKITWTDTTSGSVSQSEVQWGLAPNGKVPPPQPFPAVFITRHGSYDNGNYFTAKPLLPNTWYAFQVRDYDIFNQAATDWSAWLPLQTQATDQVQLVLNYNNMVVGFGTLTSDGSFSTTIMVPLSVPPGNYVLTAVLSGQSMAQTPITVLAEGQPLSPVLQVVDPNTLIPYPTPTGVVGDSLVTTHGENFNPGFVNLFIDAINGTSLGSATVLPNQNTFTQPVTWPLGVIGLHSIVAQQGALPLALVGVYAQNPPQ